MDNFLSGLFGGHDDDAPEARQQRANDFVQRVEQGNPAEDVSTEEVVHNYKNVASQLPDNEYVDAAREALARFSPRQRQEFGQLLNQHTGATIHGDIDDPQEIAQITNQLRSSGGGGGLAGLLGGGGSDDLMNAISGLIGGGGGSAQPHQQGGMSDLLSNPVVKAIMAAIAAMAMKKYAGGAGGGFGGIFGGDDHPRTQAQTPAGTRPAREAPRTRDHDDDGGGGIMDALFGGDDDKNDDDKRDRSDILKRKDKPQSI